MFYPGIKARKLNKRKRQNKEEKNKGITNQPENNLKIVDNKFIPLNNYFKCKWTKFSEQKTQNVWMY